MSNETNPTDRPGTDEAHKVGQRSALDTDNVDEKMIHVTPSNPAAKIDPDAPGLSVLGEQSGPAVEPNEPA